MRTFWLTLLCLLTTSLTGCADHVVPVGDTTGQFPPVVRAAVKQDFDQIRQLVQAGADLSAIEPIFGRTALHWAAMTGNTQIASFLIAHGAPLEARDKTEQTALYEAAFAGKNAIVAMLLEQGADINVVDKFGTPILVAASNLNNEGASTLRMLLDAGVEVNQTDASHNATALHWAAYYGMAKQVALLLSEGADSIALDKDKKTPRDWAESRDRQEMIEILDFHGEHESG